MQGRPMPSAQPSTQPNQTAPPVPPSFGGPTAQNFNIRSPLSGPPAQADFDPWSNFQQSRTAYASGGIPASNPVPLVGTRPPMHAPGPASGNRKPWDPRSWSASEIKVAKELKPFSGLHSTYKIWANRVKDHFKKKTAIGHISLLKLKRRKLKSTEVFSK